MDYNHASYNEIVRHLILQNRGINNFFSRTVMSQMLQDNGLHVSKSATKTEIYTQLRTIYTDAELAEIGGIGLRAWVFQRKFGICHDDIRWLAKKKIIRIVGKEKADWYGQKSIVNIYSIEDFCNLTQEGIHHALSKRKTRKK